MKSYIPAFLLIVFISFTPFFTKASAQSTYVLPYPSAMPGSTFYKIHRIYEDGMKYWYFGNFGQFKYNLKQSDKYLVEAKTLFEYRQYLLAANSLKKSDNYFKNINQYLVKAKNEKKNIDQKQNLLKEASLRHIEILNEISNDIPEIFTWQPEKSSPTVLNLKQLINNSIDVRKEVL